MRLDPERREIGAERREFGADGWFPWRLQDMGFVLACLGVVLALTALGTALDEVSEREGARHQQLQAQQLAQACRAAGYAAAAVSTAGARP
ncbi:MAG: hypothetical protein HS128_19325 [Ideonella sp.]|nr:hypothetical protein [Ideonella sp.]MCC7455957.1 hypothetical protein [Nitrospira sp.]